MLKNTYFWMYAVSEFNRRKYFYPIGYWCLKTKKLNAKCKILTPCLKPKYPWTHNHACPCFWELHWNTTDVTLRWFARSKLFEYRCCFDNDQKKIPNMRPFVIQLTVNSALSVYILSVCLLIIRRGICLGKQISHTHAPIWTPYDGITS